MSKREVIDTVEVDGVYVPVGDESIEKCPQQPEPVVTERALTKRVLYRNPVDEFCDGVDIPSIMLCNH